MESGVVARFAPAEDVLPWPTDLYREADSPRLRLPLDQAMTDSEFQWRQFLNRLDGWPTASAISIPFSGPIDLYSVNEQTLQLWRWGDQPEKLEWVWQNEGLDEEKPTLNCEDTTLLLYPPRNGWALGQEYVLLITKPGAEPAQGIRDHHGAPVEGEDLFLQLRDGLPVESDTPEEFSPEEASQKLNRFLHHFEELLMPPQDRFERKQVVVLTSFTTTNRPEIIMDDVSQRGPIPSDILRSSTGQVRIPVSPSDHHLVKRAKAAVRQLNGFGLSGHVVVEVTAPLDPASVALDRAALFELSSTEPPRPVPLASLTLTSPATEDVCQTAPVAPSCRYLAIRVLPEQLPLAADRTYAVVLYHGLRDETGAPLSPMADAQMLRSEFPLVEQGRGQRRRQSLDHLRRLEPMRHQVDQLLDQLGRETVVAAWPFTTMTVIPQLRQFVEPDPTIPPDPFDVEIQELSNSNRGSALEDLFPGITGAPARALFSGRLKGVGRVVRGSIWTRYRLDRVTRRLRPGETGELEAVPFVMTVPDRIPSHRPLEVAVFGHCIVTDSRFLMTVAGPLAERGVVSIAIDFPFHGERTVCLDTSLAGIPNILPEPLRELTGLHEDVYFLPPCRSGADATCTPEGQCLDAEGNPEPLNSFLTIGDEPALMDLYPAAGAAFLNINDLPYFGDSVMQTLIDLTALKQSLIRGNWEELLGVELETSHFLFYGQSLGSIVGSVFVALDEDFRRAVFNVPGADLVNLFLNSLILEIEQGDYWERQSLLKGSASYSIYETLCRWMTDRVDPHSVLHIFRSQQRRGLIQMDAKPPGDIVIPNDSTRVFARVSGFPVTEYNSFMHFDLVMPIAGDAMLDELVEFLLTP
jgi:hypothetical protein